MPIALSPRETFEYQLIDDRQPATKEGGERLTDPAKTIFIFRPLTLDEDAEVQDAALNSAGDLRYGTFWLVRLRRGLKGWRNFADAAGKPIEFSLANLERLSIKHRIELAEAHFRHYSLTTTEGN